GTTGILCQIERGTGFSQAGSMGVGDQIENCDSVFAAWSGCA
ncbi:hypothetical protein T265_15990, partial [Opisthorchis viverrini]